MGDMDSNMNLLLEAGISSAMFDIDPGDEVNHPAQQFLNSADGNQSMSVDESPNFESLGADNVMGSPPLLPLQGEVDGVEESVLADVVATSIAGNVAAAASAVPPRSEHVEVPIPAEQALLPTVVPAAAAAAAASVTAQSNNMFSRGTSNNASCTTSRLRQRSDSEVTRKSTAMLKEQWMSRYKELIEWKRKHGNCNVPQREKKLGCWVSTQRTQYKLLCEGRQSQMNQERIDLLNALDFDWDPRGIWRRVRKGSVEDDDTASPATAKGADRNDRKWKIWFDQLVQYREKYGHCIVTRKQDNSLGIWVQKQRKFFRERQAGKTSNILTSEKVALLNSIGFTWVVCPGTKSGKPASPMSDDPKTDAKAEEAVNSQPVQKASNKDNLKLEWDDTGKDVDSDQWDQMFFELSQYKVINGHTNVQPWPTEPRVCKLSAWCDIQRQHYASLWSDRCSQLTENQIKQLNHLGFDWTISSSDGDEEWAAKLEMLRQYHVANGHTNVPRNHGILGAWVDAQRIAMKNMLEGKTSHPGQTQMTWERFSRLEALGFEFTVRSGLSSSDEEVQEACHKSL